MPKNFCQMALQFIFACDIFFRMNTKHLEKHWGSREQAQKVIGISRQLFNHWQAGKIPPMRQYQIEVLTSGKLKADRK